MIYSRALLGFEWWLRHIDFRGKRRLIERLSYSYKSTRTLSIGRNAYLLLNMSDALQRKMWLDKYEDEDTAFLIRLVKPKTVFIDIGANIGWFTIHVGDCFRGIGQGEVIAFEPDPHNLRQLEHNIKLSGLSNVQLYQQAVSDMVGIGRFKASDPTVNSGWGGLTNKPLESEDVIEVEITTLDQLLSDESSNARSLPISVIKIDVEGHEMEVLQGAHQLLTKFNPALMIEMGHLHPPEAYATLLAQYGYGAYLANGKMGDEALKPQGKGPWNVFFLGKKDIDRIGFSEVKK